MKKKLSIPKKTFSNLPVIKQQKIVDALVDEFATNGYQKASLNTVVKTLGISKGSLYQYFENKEAIFLFVFDQFTGLVKEMAAPSSEHNLDDGSDFWQRVKVVLWAGVLFVESYPAYFQLYLNVLFEHDIPRREELISRVRLFSKEYFGPIVVAGQENGTVNREVPARMVVFIIDAAIDRFVQGYARSFLDGGLGLSGKNRQELAVEIDIMLEALQKGLIPK